MGGSSMVAPTVLETAGKRTMRCENTIILRTDPFTFMFLELGINEVCEIARGIVKELRDLPVGVGFGYLAPGHWSTAMKRICYFSRTDPFTYEADQIPGPATGMENCFTPGMPHTRHHAT